MLTDPTSTVGAFSDQISTGLVIVWILERLKKATWLPFLSQHTDTWNRVASVFMGSVAAAGIMWTYDPTGGVLTVQGLTAVNALTFLWIVAKQAIFQEAFYKGLVKPMEVAAQAKVTAAKDKAQVISAVVGQ